jgi:hypothetical protein
MLPGACLFTCTLTCAVPLLASPTHPSPPAAAVHWGSNWGFEVPQEQRSFAHALIDEGKASATAWQADTRTVPNQCLPYTACIAHNAPSRPPSGLIHHASAPDPACCLQPGWMWCMATAPTTARGLRCTAAGWCCTAAATSSATLKASRWARQGRAGQPGMKGMACSMGAGPLRQWRVLACKNAAAATLSVLPRRTAAGSCGNSSSGSL